MLNGEAFEMLSVKYIFLKNNKNILKITNLWNYLRMAVSKSLPFFTEF